MTDAPTMQPAELEVARMVLGAEGRPMPAAELGALCYVSERQAYRWLSGEATVPPLAAEKIRRKVGQARAYEAQRQK